MSQATKSAKTPREHFMRAVEDELSKFERKERSFRQAVRQERADQLRLPITRNALKTGDSSRQH
jgi:hypothetical protein